MEISDHFQKTLRALNHKGAFLAAELINGQANIMTIGWGTLGTIWGKPIFTVLVRPSRNTFKAITEGASFTINVPVNGLQKELLFCGTKSGRDFDKIKETGLILNESKKVKAPIIEQCQIHYECIIVNQTQLNKNDFLLSNIINNYYSNDDYHLLIFGKIVASYCEENL